MSERPSNDAYWKANLRILRLCLTIWVLASLGFAILLRPLFDGIQIGGTDLGFWLAQEGSVLVFLVMIFYYAWRVNRIDGDAGVQE